MWMTLDLAVQVSDRNSQAAGIWDWVVGEDLGFTWLGRQSPAAQVWGGQNRGAGACEGRGEGSGSLTWT